MAEVAKERAVALRKSLKEEMQHARKPSLSDAEAFFLGALLLDEPKRDDEEAIGKQGDNQGEDGERELSDEILFSLPPPESLTGQKAELPAHHKPAKRFSVKGLWKAHEKGFHPGKLLRQAAKSAEEDPLAGTDVSTGEYKRTECTAETENDEDDDAASDVEVRPDIRSDASSAASSWDENDHVDNFDTWEVSESSTSLFLIAYATATHV